MEGRWISMIKKHVVRATGARQRFLGVAVGAIATIATLGSASPALAIEHHPKGEFAPFADCPLSTSPLEDCVLAETKSGKFTVGKRTVPITKTIVLQGGFREIGTTEKLEFIGAEDGNTLSKSPQPVPGGLLGVVAPEFLPKFLQEIVNKLVSEGLDEVTALTELAAPANHIGLSTENLLFETGTAVSLPIKIKLNNAFLGESCYIGSNAAPVVIDFTTGTTKPPAPNEPIKGTSGTFGHNAEFTLITLTGNKLVNNSFAAPKAEGCGGLLAFLINPAVNAELGLPAAGGLNTAILEGNVSTALASAVTESE
jgi:hypothetical protein